LPLKSNFETGLLVEGGEEKVKALLNGDHWEKSPTEANPKTSIHTIGEQRAESTRHNNKVKDGEKETRTLFNGDDWETSPT
jgi:hypothetical protein